jgi:hypothetical protein
MAAGGGGSAEPRYFRGAARRILRFLDSGGSEACVETGPAKAPPTVEILRVDEVA